MKFTKGYWLKRDGVRALHPAELHSAVVGMDTLTVYAPGRALTGRADTLDQALITVTCTSPMPDVVRVEISHFRGARPRSPEFALPRAPTPVEITTEPEV